MKRFAIALAVVALAALGAGDTWAQQRGGGGGGSGGGGRPGGGGAGAGPSHGGSHGGYRGHGGGHYGGSYGHSHWYGGVYLGSPWYWGWPSYGWGWDWGYPYYRPYAYGYGYGYPYYEPAPSVYVERSVAPEAEVAPAPPNVWYYCTDPAGYYPYVQNCKALWVPVKPFGPAAEGAANPAPATPSYSTTPPGSPAK